MYDLLDRPVAALPAFERRVLDRTRRWAHAFALAGSEATGGDDALGTVMHALDRGSADDIVIQRPCFATVDESEALIVALWRLVRDRRADAARALAAGLVDARHADVLLDGIARALAAD